MAGEKLSQDHDQTALFSALANLRSPKEARRFLADLATPAEIRSLAERWRIARMLDQGGRSYREIAAETGASTTTVVRVARFLNEERNNGYRLMLDRMKQMKKTEG
jgi:TrpR-related protein YerC/YecD